MDITKCPIRNPLYGNDPEFDAILKNINIDVDDKMLVFLTICIVLRYLIAGLSLQYYETDIFPYIFMVITIFALFIVGRNVNQDQWWSRRMHLFIISLILISSLYQITTNERNVSIPILLYTDVTFGLLTFLYVYSMC